MNFKISSWAIRNPISIIVLFLLLTVLDIRAFQGLPTVRRWICLLLSGF